jgi:hypothetical protein
LKLPSLLSQYLREQKTLSLPGIGIFHLTGPLPPDDETSLLLSSRVQFENKKVKEADDNLISFIKQETGKIKPLAIADLESFISSGMEMLNMGKPFQLEGIGNIQKNKNGQLEFVASEPVANRHELGQAEHDKRISVFEDSKYEPKSNPLQKILAVGLLLAGVAVVVLGGYYLYNKSNNVKEVTEEESLNKAPVQAPVTDTVVSKPDSSQIVKLPSTYKFILETTNSKNRAYKRYNQLKSLAIDVKIESPDSIYYKLYFVIPATAADTIRIKDSLQNYYGRRVIVEL